MSSSTTSMASRREGPAARRSGPSRMNEIDAANPSRAAACATPTASGTLLKVRAWTGSTSALTNVAMMSDANGRDEPAIVPPARPDAVNADQVPRFGRLTGSRGIAQ